MRILFSFLVIVSFIIAGCLDNSTGQYVHQPPVKHDDGTTVGTLDEVNIDSALIAKAILKILSDRDNEVHSLLVARNGKLVVEEYFPGHRYKWDAPSHHGEFVDWNYSTLHTTASASKSIVSACIGIAIDKGFIRSVHQSIFDYLPGYEHLATGGKERITIENVLTMTTGLEWREWSAPYSSVDNPAVGIWFSDKDPITFILEMPLIHEPGTHFTYSTGNMALLGEILRNASGKPLDEFSQEYLFEPLGIDSAMWPLVFPNGVHFGNNLETTPRSMLKFGMLYLNDGSWNNKRVVSQEWVLKSSRPFGNNRNINVPGEASGKVGYAYTWWTKDYSSHGMKIHTYTASGFGGQHIMVLPEVNTVVVFTGGNYLTRRPPYKLLRKYIIPAIQ